MASPITSEAEFAAVRRWRRGDARAADALIMAQQGMVVTLARKFASYSGVTMSDLVQEGNIGLLRALEKYEPSRKLRFITYAIWWVRAHMAERVRRDRSVVRHPTKVRLAGYDSSLDAPWLAGAEEPMVERLPAPECDVMAARVSVDDERRVGAALRGLDGRTRDIIRRRYMADEPETLKEIGVDWGLSRERVRQIEQRALKKLRILLAA